VAGGGLSWAAAGLLPGDRGRYRIISSVKLEVLRKGPDVSDHAIITRKGKNKNKNLPWDIRIVINRNYAAGWHCLVGVGPGITFLCCCAAFGTGTGTKTGARNRESGGQTNNRGRVPANGETYPVPVLVELAAWVDVMVSLAGAEAISLSRFGINTHSSYKWELVRCRWGNRSPYPCFGLSPRTPSLLPVDWLSGA
jgi:hypothetical protein